MLCGRVVVMACVLSLQEPLVTIALSCLEFEFVLTAKGIESSAVRQVQLLLRLNSESSCCKFWRPGAQCVRVSLRTLYPNGSALAVLNQPEMRNVETRIISVCDARRGCAGIK